MKGWVVVSVLLVAGSLYSFMVIFSVKITTKFGHVYNTDRNPKAAFISAIG